MSCSVLLETWVENFLHTYGDSYTGYVRSVDEVGSLLKQFEDASATHYSSIKTTNKYGKDQGMT